MVNKKATDAPEHETNTESAKGRRQLTNVLKIIAFVILALALLYTLFIGYLFVVSPASIRQPAFQHYHFRMQVLVDGKAVNFGHQKFQIPAGKDVCSADLTQQPIHFHDNKDQMVHIHWDGMTGGLVLKNYGWNYMGGAIGALGYRFDNMPRIQKVPIYGNVLPEVGPATKLFVFTGDEKSFKERKSEEFLKQDLETFFDKKSNLPGGSQSSWLDKLFPKAAAHAGHDHSDTAGAITDQEQLKKLNNLIGNVVIFAQDERPTDAQVKSRFQKLEPLSDSSCAG